VSAWIRWQLSLGTRPMPTTRELELMACIEELRAELELTRRAHAVLVDNNHRLRTKYDRLKKRRLAYHRKKRRQPT
jgi:hypothetical protein